MEESILVTMSRKELGELIESKVHEATKHLSPRPDLPYLLTRSEAKDFLRVSETKMSELMGRTDFPVCREIGVKIYTDKLLAWLEKHTNDV